MLLGCTSDAGKSFLAAGLCRLFANRGQRVAPFKAQNMSNNAAVTPDGLEMGRAQYLQALAARAVPQARMNPVLLKPSADTYSQVVVMGRVEPEISALPWLERKERLWPVVRSALHSLLDEYEQVIIEGAGSPAEVNLRQSDIVNMAVALECGAECYLIADIDRGGAFAHLLGTYACLAPEERALIKGFVLNKFRGDPALLGNAMDWLRERTGVPTVAIVPLIRHALPEEDTLHHRAQPAAGQVNVALIVYPYASNLDEFDPLIHEPGVTVVPLRDRLGLAGFDAIILPGSKNTAESLRYLRQTGLAAEVLAAAERGQAILGVCGGLQLLGRQIDDLQHIESGSVPGLGLLDVTTTLAAQKTTRQRQARWLAGGGAPAGGLPVAGYEIHHGQTRAGPLAQPHLDEELGWQQGTVCGVYLHGLLENTAYRQWWLERLGWQGQAQDWHARLEAELDRLAGVVEEAFGGEGVWGFGSSAEGKP
jgi:adenosylcobyric acid synthase